MHLVWQLLISPYTTRNHTSIKTYFDLSWISFKPRDRLWTYPTLADSQINRNCLLKWVIFHFRVKRKERSWVNFSLIPTYGWIFGGKKKKFLQEPIKSFHGRQWRQNLAPYEKTVHFSPCYVRFFCNTHVALFSSFFSLSSYYPQCLKIPSSNPK